VGWCAGGWGRASAATWLGRRKGLARREEEGAPAGPRKARDPGQGLEDGLSHGGAMAPSGAMAGGLPRTSPASSLGRFSRGKRLRAALLLASAARVHPRAARVHRAAAECRPQRPLRRGGERLGARAAPRRGVRMFQIQVGCFKVYIISLILNEYGFHFSIGSSRSAQSSAPLADRTDRTGAVTVDIFRHFSSGARGGVRRVPLSCWQPARRAKRHVNAKRHIWPSIHFLTFFIKGGETESFHCTVPA